MSVLWSKVIDMNEWKTKNNKKIPYNELETSHLINIIAFIKRRASEGIKIQYGGCCGSLAEDMWYDYDVIYGEDVYNRTDYYKLKNELNMRRNNG